MTEGEGSDTQRATYGREQVVDIINSVLSKLQGPQAQPHDAIAYDLTVLRDVVLGFKNQLNAMPSVTFSQDDIPTAKDELDEVICTTEKATAVIMDSCEKILSQMEGADPALLQMAEAEIVKIYEACTFQDITGQRISKVIKTLKKIDEQVSALLGTIDSQLEAMGQGQAPAIKNDSELMNGPQMPQNAMSQEDIDKILESF